MAELFQTTKQNTSLHIRNIFEEGELGESSFVKYSLTTAADRKKYKTFINYDANNEVSRNFFAKHKAQSLTGFCNFTI